MPDKFAPDINAIARIDAIPSILEVVCRTTGMGFAAVARVTEERWIACAVRDEIGFGLKVGGELQIETTICNEIRDHGQAVVIDNVAHDPSYCQHHTPARYGFQSYISLPIFYPDGRFFGTLCSIDPKPAKLNRPEIVKMFRLFADLIMLHLQAQDKVVTAQAELREHRDMASMRERFVAVLGHDLRNPLSAIAAGSEILERENLSSRGATALRLMQRSVKRMAGLINDVLDVARVHLGDGIALDCRDLLREADLQQVIDELHSAWPDREIHSCFVITEDVPCDLGRISQLFSNLVGNALTHGAEKTPVNVTAHCQNGFFEFSVGNQGLEIPSSVLEKLFKPFSRHADDRQSSGLGLGLYIALEVAHAHGGTLEVSSTPEETVFLFRMPLTQGR